MTMDNYELKNKTLRANIIDLVHVPIPATPGALSTNHQYTVLHTSSQLFFLSFFSIVQSIQSKSAVLTCILFFQPQTLIIYLRLNN